MRPWSAPITLRLTSASLDIFSLEGETIRVEGKLELYKAKDYGFRTGFEVLGIRFGLNPCNLAQIVSPLDQLANSALEGKGKNGNHAARVRNKRSSD